MSSNKMQSRRGFALILIVGLVAFLLVLMIALAASLRVENRLTANNQRWHEARQNALTGLNIALGRLQELAGPDARVTANADLLNTDPDNPVVTGGNRYWSGVWDSSNQHFLAWLTSEGGLQQTSTEVQTLPQGDTVYLVKDAAGDDPENWIPLTRQPLKIKNYPGYPEGSEVTAGHFAWWVGDEGLKLSLGKVASEDLDSLGPWEQSRLDLATYRKTDLGHLDSDLQKAESRELLSHARAYDQVLGIKGVGESFMEKHFHDCTLLARGVLAGTTAGTGLKQDLSQMSSGTAGGISVNADLVEYLNHRPDKDDYVHLRAPANNSGTGFSICGIPTEMSLRFGFSALASDDKGQVSLLRSFACDVWNPYSFPIKGTPKGVMDFQYEILNLPTLTLSTNDPGAPTYTINLQNTNTHVRDIDLWDEMPPGQVRKFVEKLERVPLGMSEPSSSLASGDLKYYLSAPAGRLTIRFKTPDGKLLWELRNLPYDALSSGPIDLRQDNPSYTDLPFRIYFRFYDETLPLGPGGLSDMEKWSTVSDPRGPVLDYNQADIAALIYNERDLYTGAAADEFLQRPEFFYGGLNKSSGNFHRFFDLPAAPVTSVAALRHLIYPGRTPMAPVNNSQLASLFDEAFLSGADQHFLPNQDSSSRTPFPNPHLMLIDKEASATMTDPEGLAGNALLNGALNINCTQAEVWESLLRSQSTEDFVLHKNPASHLTQTVDLDNPLFRLPFGADRHYTYPAAASYPNGYDRTEWWKNSWSPDWAKCYTIGLRELTDDEVEELAEAIVTVLRERGKPVFSLGELVRSGLLQEAIDHTSINTINGKTYNTTSSDKRFPYMAPAFLHQGDILNSLAPILQARSDTFKIRSYGDVLNPVTGEIEGRAWCEAIVQRVPETLDPAVDIRDEATGLGRKFKIINFRWLDVSDI